MFYDEYRDDGGSDDSMDSEEEELLATFTREEGEKDYEDKPLPGWVPGGAMAWDTTSRLLRPEGPKMMGRKISEFVEKKQNFVEKVIIQSDEPFVSKPLTLTEGPFKGYRVLLLEPTPRASFLGLPAELRNTIYSHLLHEKKPIRITSSGGRAIRIRSDGCVPDIDDKKRKKRSPRNLGLPLVNKQVATETLATIYGANSFEFKTTRALANFLTAAPTMRQHLRQITLPSASAFVPGRCSDKLPVDNLKSITIESEAVVVHALTGEGKVNLTDLVHELVPFLRRWDAAHCADPESKSVLDVVKFKEFRRCEECGEDLTACKKIDCRRVFVPRRGKDHLEKVSTEFKRMVAEELGVGVLV